MDPISIALGLAQFVPTIVRWIGGDDAGDNAQKIVNVANAVTGNAGNPVAAIGADPALQIQFQTQMAQLELTFYQEDTKRMDLVNQTMRAEAASNSPMQRGWRPFWGYITGFAFGTQMLGVTWLIFARPSEVAGVVTALASLTALWGIALTVLGVQVVQRSADKLAALTGAAPPPSLMQSIAAAIHPATAAPKK
jgi:hypothetical protein